MKTASGVCGLGLFVKQALKAGAAIIEYTGNLISGFILVRMEQAFYNYGEDLEGFVLVNGDRKFIEPRGIGNDAQFVNHSWNKNSELLEVKVGNKARHDCSSP